MIKGMWFRWMPWKILVRYAARRYGFLDPINLLSQLQRFLQPSEFNEPVELLRAGALMHARGLINNRVIQHNLDWVWPHWVERQFNPQDVSFIPRAFSITHINLSHRNWTAVGLPDFPDLPIVDERGLVTPFIDGWSLDTWLVTKRGRKLLPSRMGVAEQSLSLEEGVKITTRVKQELSSLTSQVNVQLENNTPTCCLEINASCDEIAWIVVALRPYNPEGVSFIHTVNLSPERKQWVIDDDKCIEFCSDVDCHQLSNYQKGDVLLQLGEMIEEQKGECNIGMLTAAAMFQLDESSGKRQVSVRIPLIQENHKKVAIQHRTWAHYLNNACILQLPEPTFQFLYDAALRSLLLHSSDDIYPGPYTYKRFWFRDTVYIIHALLCAGLTDRAEQAIDKFSSRQDLSGYFHSQEGEWDSNGQVLWILHRYCQFTGLPPKAQWLKMIRRGADWIMRKRLPYEGKLYDGLLPAGFSAEHLGPNNYYYWDNFWGIAGLQAAQKLFAMVDDTILSQKYEHAAKDFELCVNNNLCKVAQILGTQAMPAAPNRRLDSGAIGSLAMGYPAQLCTEKDERILQTAEFLLENCCVNKGFFQDMTHSGINAYLTLHLAQVLMRAGDQRYQGLLQRVADLASSTGQWPEAIHPQTGGGCMGDGQHVWASAEWVIMMRNCFIREEVDCLVIGAGICEEWLISKQTLQFGPAPTQFGDLTITIKPLQETSDNSLIRHLISWSCHWHDKAPVIEVRLPGRQILYPAFFDTSIICEAER